MACLEAVEAVVTSSLTTTGKAEQVAPNVLSFAHWERILEGELYAPTARIDWRTLCKAVQHSRLYVSAEGLVFPCCWTGALYPPGRPAGTAQIWELVRPLPEGKASLDGRTTSIRDIVEGPFFQTLVPEGWPKRSVADGRLEPCVRACGGTDTHAAQYGASLL